MQFSKSKIWDLTSSIEDFGFRFFSPSNIDWFTKHVPSWFWEFKSRQSEGTISLSVISNISPLQICWLLIDSTSIYFVSGLKNNLLYILSFTILSYLYLFKSAISSLTMPNIITNIKGNIVIKGEEVAMAGINCSIV